MEKKQLLKLLNQIENQWLTMCKFQGCAWWFAVGGFTLIFPFPSDRISLATRPENLALNVVRQCKKTTDPQMAHLVFADTRANNQKTKRAIFCHRTDSHKIIGLFILYYEIQQ
jgi:hypothetical protein